MTFWKDTPGVPLTRKWQCFVCGSQFDDFESYKEHILLQHEEGREYVKCPVDICQAPVRDLRAHYRAKHPSRAMPQHAQLRALVWRDFKPGGAKGKTRKVNVKEGYFTSSKMGGAKLHFRSGYEEKVYECLERDDEVLAFHVEPLEIPYYFNNDWHKYIPDIKVVYTDGVVELWEVKPEVQLDFVQNQEKFRSARKFTENMGWGFRTITENEISALQSKVRRQNR